MSNGWRGMRWWLAALAAAGLCGSAAAQGTSTAETPPIPAEAFYKDPALEDAKLSPSGRWLALRSSVGGQKVRIVIFDVQAWKMQNQAAHFFDADIGDVHWVNDDRLIFTVLDRARGGGNQRFWHGLFSVERDGTGLRQLVKTRDDFVRDHSPIREMLSPAHTLLHVPAGGGDEVIVGEWRFNGVGDFEGIVAKRLNTATGRASPLSRGAPPNVWSYLFDAAGEPRVAVTRREGRAAVHWRAPGATEWRQISESDALNRPFLTRFIDDAGALFVTERSGPDGTSVLKRFDFAAGKPAADALVATPGFDFQGGIVSETVGSRVLGVRTVTDAETTVWFDKRMAALQAEADRMLPGRVNRLSCRRCGEGDMTAIVTSWSDQNPGQIWWTSAATGEWRKIGDRRPDIDPRRMAITDFARIKARDGLEIPVWVTRPPGRDQASRPAVLLVHGGPWVRGRSWQWDADAQFLASRGYVVIEPEFRGSQGYGDKLHRAGWRQWGRAMQDDLIDALDWAASRGWVDPKRVCIAGASYGGYATLMGLARDGERFRCGAAWVAVSDPRLLYEWSSASDIDSELREHDLPRKIGDLKADAAMLDSVTPVLLAEGIRAPLLLAYGAQDRRVPLVHGQRLRKALVDAGRPPEWVLYDDEAHGWLKLSTRVDFARRLETFLAQHLR